MPAVKKRAKLHWKPSRFEEKLPVCLRCRLSIAEWRSPFGYRTSLGIVYCCMGCATRRPCQCKAVFRTAPSSSTKITRLPRPASIL
jgi:hypothetical protein